MIAIENGSNIIDAMLREARMFFYSKILHSSLIRFFGPNDGDECMGVIVELHLVENGGSYDC